MRALLILVACFSVSAQQQVSIRVDLSRPQDRLKPIYRFFGYDEPNYTYMPNGRKLLSELAALADLPVYVRAHNLLTSGDGTPALKWGSTNAYTEKPDGTPNYDWTIVDRILDTYIERGMKPIVEIGFMPEALSRNPQPYRHNWDPSQPYKSIYTGWAYPPRDYRKWADLVSELVRHSIARYGRAEVATWYWEVWNEPDIAYWQGTPEEYHKLYDFSASAVKQAMPEARIGGPTSTGPGSERAAAFLRGFLEHVLRGTNYATGKTGSPLDYITFHAKGRPKVVAGHVQMGSEFQLRDIDKGFEIVSSFPELKRTPILLGESDPEGCAACSVRYNPQNAYRNGTMYSSYTAATFARKHELAARHGVNFEGAVTWAFEFEGQPYFDGFRDLATNGIDKPVLNVFRMLGLMRGDRVRSESSGASALDAMLRSGVKASEDVGAVAAREANSATVLVWNYHDDDVAAPPAQIDLQITGLATGTARRVLVEHFRVDGDHSNSYSAWKALGSPQQPDTQQYTALERAGQLQMLGSPEWHSVQNEAIRLTFSLPRQGVSLLRLTW